MRSILKHLTLRPWKSLAGLMLMAGAAVALTPDDASAQRGGRGGGRGGVGVRAGGVGVGVGPGGGVSVGVGRGYGGWYGGYGGGYGRGGYGYGRGGYGYGLGGIGIGIGGIGGGYGGGYGSSGYSASPVVIPSQGIVSASAADVQPATSTSDDTAMVIADVSQGPARQAGLQRGDVIISVNGVRTRHFEDLRSALTAGPSPVAVEFFNQSTGQRSSANVMVNNGTIGVSVVETPVSFQ